ncbi:hypothetical protein V2K41_10565 [Pseudomonas alliivorans]|nr:hypothetical protein [Pseudomonas alliivorans]MEE4683442.1 hypothetical protein [Pseudomonas alliivorans]MEE4914717.1 hypothetical protein [Pseudomonas alliivorans]
MDVAIDNVRADFLKELVSSPPDLIASLWILSRVPFPFNGDAKRYEQWRNKLAGLVKVDSSEILITGSGAFGISLNPYKNYRAFDEKSDIDVAIVSEHFFNISWRYLRNLGTGMHSMSPAAKQSVTDHVQKYIYWGTIATDKLLPYMPFGKDWAHALELMSSVDPTRGRKIKARIYKDFDSLRAYQVNNLKSLRTHELEKD